MFLRKPWKFVVFLLLGALAVVLLFNRLPAPELVRNLLLLLTGIGVASCFPQRGVTAASSQRTLRYPPGVLLAPGRVQDPPKVRRIETPSKPQASRVQQSQPPKAPTRAKLQAPAQAKKQAPSKPKKKEPIPSDLERIEAMQCPQCLSPLEVLMKGTKEHECPSCHTLILSKREGMRGAIHSLEIVKYNCPHCQKPGKALRKNRESQSNRSKCTGCHSILLVKNDGSILVSEVGPQRDVPQAAEPSPPVPQAQPIDQPQD